MSIEQFAQGVAFLASRSPVFGEKPLSVTLIANPRAGGFTRRAGLSVITCQNTAWFRIDEIRR